MIIEEKCPKCGERIFNEVLTSYPPIPRKVCYNCGWRMDKERAVELIEMAISEAEWGWTHDEGEWDLIEALKIVLKEVK